jgi:hypothetical protein
MANPSCIVESGKLSPVGQRQLALFQAQDAKRILVVLMAPSHLSGGYFGPDPRALPHAEWALPFRAVGISVSASGNGLRSDTKAVIVLTASEWATRRNLGRFKDNVLQVWGDGGDAQSWPVMPADAPLATGR